MVKNSQNISFTHQKSTSEASDSCPKIGLLMKTCQITNLYFRAKKLRFCAKLQKLSSISVWNVKLGWTFVSFNSIEGEVSKTILRLVATLFSDFKSLKKRRGEQEHRDSRWQLLLPNHTLLLLWQLKIRVEILSPPEWRLPPFGRVRTLLQSSQIGSSFSRS